MNQVNVEQIIEAAGGVSAVSERLAISYEAVRKWVVKNRIPAERVMVISIMTNEQYSPESIRPDVFLKSFLLGTA
ncbi:transcriptional regulator [Hydrogenovibrio marinus]|uniref:Regulatory protein n=1 Tax=Hydrogenovibrio marinus TaxID=28885 RepID=A0A066ZWE6_HYDMR|nr:Cro/CI family transcriptional regulator [Hydrogenovibrio marinus]KDN96599.1 hypothetical protein EI16_10120 [Hydrogenovibrio marinus]BBN60191.1 hypothetical protein HVMH_1785 [Hydrogenovibrio marinus]